MTHILIIGAGNMGTSLGTGLLRESENIVYYKTRYNSYADFEHIKDLWIFLAVKPYHLKEVLQEANTFFMKVKPQAIISMVAGIDTKTIQSELPENIDIIRTMPNTPISTGNGIIGYYTNNKLLGKKFTLLCQSLGIVHELVNEDDFHLFTALAGSGPAYIFHMVESLTIAASTLGMEYHSAEDIAKQLLIGVSTMLHKDAPMLLRQSVTSPNGTTQAGLERLMNVNLQPETSKLTHLLIETLEAAQKRSINMYGDYT